MLNYKNSHNTFHKNPNNQLTKHNSIIVKLIIQDPPKDNSLSRVYNQADAFPWSWEVPETHNTQHGKHEA